MPCFTWWWPNPPRARGRSRAETWPARPSRRSRSRSGRSRGDGEQGEEPVVPHAARGYASADGRRAGHQTATHRSPRFWDAGLPRDCHEATTVCGAGSPAVPEPRAVPARPDPARARPRRGPDRAAARARQVLRDRLVDPRRVLHGAGRRASRTRSSRARRCARRTAGRRSRRSSRSARACSTLTAAQTRLWRDELARRSPPKGSSSARSTTRPTRSSPSSSASFLRQIFPVLTPLAVGPGQPFPYISGLSLSLGLLVRDPEAGEERFARVKVPEGLDRVRRGRRARAAHPARERDRALPRPSLPGDGGRRARRVPADAGRRHRDLRRRRRSARGGRVGGAQAAGSARSSASRCRARSRGRCSPGSEERLGVSSDQVYPVRGVLDLADVSSCTRSTGPT